MEEIIKSFGSWRELNVCGRWGISWKSCSEGLSWWRKVGMPGASSVSSGGGSGGGTKRKASDSSHGHSPSVGGAASSHSTASAMSTSGNVCYSEGGGSNVNGASGGSCEGGGMAASASAGAADGKNGPQQPSTAVMKMKAEVFEKDRDNFLSSFEKPTQIYRFLRARMLESPIFLHRNLSYMKSRMSRSHSARVDFKVDNMNKKLEIEKKHLPRSSHVSSKSSLGTFQTKGPIKFFNVIVMGFTDGQLWLPDTRARVDVCVARVCFNKRKEGAGPVTKVFEKCVDLKIHSPSSPKPSHDVTIPYPKNCPVVPIPVELCSLGSNGHTVRSFKLVIRVTIPRKCLQKQNNFSKSDQQTNHLNSRNSYNSDTSLDEPKAKRRRSAPTTKDRENFIYDGESNNKTGNGGAGGGIAGDKLEEYIVYTGHISLYEHDIPGDKIKEIDLDLQLRKLQRGNENRVSHQRIRREISWEAFDEKHSKVLEQAKPAGRCAKVCVAIRTSSETKPKFVDPPPPLLCAALKKEGALNDENSKMSLACQEMRNSVRVIYHFIYGSNSQQQTESRDDLRCPWCSINCMQLYSLMKHLKLCHPRYLFTYSPIPNGAKIDVAINDSYDGSYSGSAYDLVCQPPGEAFARNGPTKRTEVFSILVCRPKPCKQTLQEFFDCDEKDVDQRRTYITGHNRLYHHTSTCLPIHPREIDVDSEGEPDPEWLRVKTTMMIDEFTDVNEGEKELMKLWNLHVMKYNYVGDCQIPFACKRFVELHGKELIQKKLYRNFCLHLTNLFDFGLLTPQGVHSTIQLLHSQIRESCTTTTHLLMTRDTWKSRAHGHAVNGLPLISETTASVSSNDYKKSLPNTGGESNDTSTPSTLSSSPSTIASSKTGTKVSNTAVLSTPQIGGIHNTANMESGGNTNYSSSSSSSSSSSTGTTHMNGIGTRKLDSKVKRFVSQEPVAFLH